MPRTTVVFFRSGVGRAPVLEWLSSLRRRDPRGFVKCLVRIRRLAEKGHELRRPECDHLRDGIFELRMRRGNLQYRVLYGFHGDGLAVLLHGLRKERMVSSADISRALARLREFAADPARHTHHEEEIDNGTS